MRCLTPKGERALARPRAERPQLKRDPLGGKRPFMKATALSNRAIVLAEALFHILATSPDASAQDTASDARVNRLPVSVSLPLVVGWAESAPRIGIGFSGVTLSAPVTASVTTGITVRYWYGYVSRQSCALNQSDCVLEQESTSLAFLAHVESYPVRNRLFFFRAAAGISWLREQDAADSVIHESRAWPLTALLAAGWDILLRDHVFATPLVEVLATAHGDAALRSSPHWITFVGVALTLR